MPPAYTDSSLSEKTGSDRRSIKKWLGANRPATEAEAIAIIRARQETPVADDANINPETGATWYQEKTRQEALRLERENRIADRLEKKTYMEVALHEQILAQVCNKLEQVPSKAKSELGLTDAQKTKLQRMIDEARNDARTEILTIKPKEEPNEN